MAVAKTAFMLSGDAASAQTQFGAALVTPPGLQPFSELTPEFPERYAGGYTLKYIVGPGVEQ